MVIIGLLAAYVGPRYFAQLGKSERGAAKAQIEALARALDAYRLDTGHYPSTAQGLTALVVRPGDEPKWNGPYLQKVVPPDPWGQPYQYRQPGAGEAEFDLLSFGKDGRVDLVESLRRPVHPIFYTMTSPPVIVRGVIVVGSSVFDWWGMRPSPPGDVRGFDIGTGRLLWTFHTVAQGEEPGTETWEKESWKEAGNANVWAPMSADEELG